MKAADLRNKSALPGSGCLKQEAEDLESRIPPRRSYENTAEFSEVCQERRCALSCWQVWRCRLSVAGRQKKKPGGRSLRSRDGKLCVWLPVGDHGREQRSPYGGVQPRGVHRPMNQFARMTHYVS